MSGQFSPFGPGDPSAGVLDRFLAAARAQGERAVAITRYVICALIIARTLVMAPGRLREGRVGDWTIFCLALATAVISYLMERRMRRTSDQSVALPLSVVIDSVVVFLVLLTRVLWQGEGYTGILRTSPFALILLAVVASSMRLSVGLALLAVLMNACGFLVLMMVDHAGARPVSYPPEELVTAVIIFLGAATLGVAITLRVQRLVRAGSRAVLTADRAERRLGAYVPSEVAREAMESAEVRLGGLRRPVAVLFSDLRGFTSYGTQISPERLVAELNAYLEAMVSAISAEGGVVDKYIGDAIMVVFGASAAQADDAARAIRAARAMQRALTRHNLQRHSEGLPPLAQGIGVHYGPAVVGHIGTQERLQYTVIGDVVNLASRLESATKEHGVPVLISKDAVEAARAADGGALPEVVKHGAIRVRGRDAELEVFRFPDDGFSGAISIETASS